MGNVGKVDCVNKKKNRMKERNANSEARRMMHNLKKMVWFLVGMVVGLVQEMNPENDKKPQWKSVPAL